MKVEALKQRLDRNRPMTSVTMRIPKNVVKDLERFEGETVSALIAGLKRHGVSESVIDEVLREVVHATGLVN